MEKKEENEEDEFFVNVCFDMHLNREFSQNRNAFQLTQDQHLNQTEPAEPSKKLEEQKNTRKKLFGIPQPVFSPLLLSENVSSAVLKESNIENFPEPNEDSEEVENDPGKVIQNDPGTFQKMQTSPNGSSRSKNFTFSKGNKYEIKGESEEGFEQKISLFSDKNEKSKANLHSEISKEQTSDLNSEQNQPMSILKNLLAGSIGNENDGMTPEERRKQNLLASIDKSKKKTNSEDNEKSRAAFMISSEKCFSHFWVFCQETEIKDLFVHSFGEIIGQVMEKANNEPVRPKDKVDKLYV